MALPALSHAKDIQWDKWDKGQKADKGEKGDKGGKGDPRISAVPGANTAWVLLPLSVQFCFFSPAPLAEESDRVEGCASGSATGAEPIRDPMPIGSPVPSGVNIGRGIGAFRSIESLQWC